jgi:cell division protein FtsI/penicillin-binding protein 2
MLAALPFLAGFDFKNETFDDELKTAVSNRGIALIADIQTGLLTGCSAMQRAIKGYPIGSLAKIITATALLEEKIIHKDHKYYCKGFDIRGNRKINCWNPNGHGIMTLETAIKESCNLYFLNQARKIAPCDLLKYYYTFKLDRPELKSESTIPPANFLPPNGLTEQLALGTDRNLLLTPANILNLSCTIARNGIYIPLWRTTPPATEEIITVSSHTMKAIQSGMKGAASTGTAKLLNEKGFRAAAKTGTAPIKAEKTCGWCTGYLPYDNPRLAFCVFVNEGTGFSDAVPLAVKVLNICKQKNLF